MNRMMTIAAAGVSLLGLVGCTGQGRHTREGTNAANQRMSMLKAGTEWQMAEQAFLAGDLDKALEKVDNSLGINDTVTKSHVLRGRVLIEMGNLGEALESLKLAEAYGPEDPDTQYFLGFVHERLGQREEALQAYQDASEFDEQNPAYAVAAAEMLMDLGRQAEARAYLNSVPSFEHHSGVRQTLGHLAMFEEDYAAAAELFEEARLLSPDDMAVVEDLVAAQMEAGRYAAADRNLLTLLDEADNEDRRDLQHTRARCLVELNRPVEARQIFRQLTEGNRGATDIEAWIGLGNMSFVVDDQRTLRRAASRITAAAPQRPDGFTLFALYHRSVGDSESALTSIETAIELEGTDATSHAFRGLLLSDLGRDAEAGASFRQAAAIDPSNSDYQALAELAAGSAFATVPTDDEN